MVAVLVSTLAVFFLGLPVDTIGSRFGAIPSSLPSPVFPQFSLEIIHELASPAIAIAILGSVESLLCATVADGMIGGHHRSNTELVAQGIANIITPIFGGIPATGAIARTAANVRNGGRTPVAGIIHALTLLLIMAVFGKYAAYIPMPALAAVLMHVAWNMSEPHALKSILRGERSDAAVMLVTFFTTVLIDLAVAIQVGVVMAAFLFVKKMADHTTVLDNQEEDKDAYTQAGLKRPEGVFIYEIDGPLFFGSVQKLLEIVKLGTMTFKLMDLRMRNVTYLDATGAQAVEQLLKECKRQHKQFIISGIRPQALNVLEKTGIAGKIGRDRIFTDSDEAMRFVAGVSE